MPNNSDVTTTDSTDATTRVHDLLLRFPGIARARVTRDASGDLRAEVLGWDAPASSPYVGPLAELDMHNPDEVQFLHDEIFVGESYLDGGIVLRQDAVVFDVGANIGAFALFVGARCPSAEVFAFEPVTDIHQQLRRNLERYGVRARMFEAGLSDRDREVTFNFYPDLSIMSCRSDYASLDTESELVKQYVQNARESGSTEREEHLARVESLVTRDFERSERRCRLRPLSAVLDETGVTRIDLLKIDVQRSELDVLLGIEDRHWPLVQQIVMEVHDEVGTPTEGRLRQTQSMLVEHGFKVSGSEVELLRGAGRYTVRGIRPEYAEDPRPVVARTGNARALRPQEIVSWLAERLPHDLVPRDITVVSELPSH
ncbi:MULTISPECIES: FkbM family methyltransferase [Streptomyces]|uniref:Methyltransferase FkbM domain-containing protein n=1 Tax=Streptomyces canarius TaxID=285453 RepID=A0ABQ3CNT9_9ACTN|nr:FkbM family methyltransferase [Streptomyces canarius]GHA33854.1 hypothetical protein GCM10010345_42990 [Streptomyces canarius]